MILSLRMRLQTYFEYEINGVLDCWETERTKGALDEISQKCISFSCDDYPVWD